MKLDCTASYTYKGNMLAFHRPGIEEKLKFLESDLSALEKGLVFQVPMLPARDLEVLAPKFHPNKIGLASLEGQARLLHDVASIELQAMELGLRTLAEFPQAPHEFRRELCEVTRSESQHLILCLAGIKSLGFAWGDWPVHCQLWSSTSSEDSLLDRILIVHRYLEGSGLDAGAQFLRRGKGSHSEVLSNILKVITEEEVGHVEFGSRWYRHFCLSEGLDPEVDFPERMWKIKKMVPRRLEKIDKPLRRRAGFTEAEILVCEEIRRSFLVLSGVNNSN